MVYPGCTPEFRMLVRADGTQVMQLRYVNISNKYTGLWQDVPVVTEAPNQINEEVKNSE